MAPIHVEPVLNSRVGEFKLALLFFGRENVAQ